METAVKRLYEGLFLVDSALAAADWQLVNDTIQKILNKAGAEVASFRKWDERKLTYDIGRVTRGTYILIYFHCDPLRIHEVERDVQLSETLMRVMILRADEMPKEDIDKPTPLMIAETQAQAEASAALDPSDADIADEAEQDVEEQL